MRSRSTRRLLFAVGIHLLWWIGLWWIRPERRTAWRSVNENTPVPICTRDTTSSPYPKSYDRVVSAKKYKTSREAEAVLSYVVTSLHKIGGMATPMFGNLLYEYRDGPVLGGPCLLPNPKDKDFDLAIFERHFEFVTQLKPEIEDKFGWKMVWNSRMFDHKILTICPPFTGFAPQGDTLNIDIYGFRCIENNTRIYFPWDTVKVELGAFLPLKKHKSVLVETNQAFRSSNDTTTITATSRNHRGGNDTKSAIPPAFYYLPHNPPCLLENIYGQDYMTPKTGKTSQAKWRTGQGLPAYGNPYCNNTSVIIKGEERYELERQLELCSA